jgi:type IX secretion system PorP/SprF family membrane protein
MIKNLLLLAICGLAIHNSSHAQQLPLYSEYLHNSFTMNPAMLGWENITAATVAYRHQWTGMPNAPRTGALSYQQWDEKNNMAFGGFFMHDQTGPTSFTTLTLNYAYHIKMGSEKKGEWLRNRLSFGLSLGGTLYQLRGRDLRYNDIDDELIINANQSKFLPDVGVGVTYYNDFYYIGFAMPQLLSSRLQYTSDDAISNLRRVTHYYLNAGVRLPVNTKNKDKKQFIIPTLFMKFAPLSPLNLTATVRYMWNYRFSAALGYATDGSIIADVNVNISKKFRMGYAFSVGVNGLAQHLGTTHDIMLTYVFGAQKTSWMFEPIENTWLMPPTKECLSF